MQLQVNVRWDVRRENFLKKIFNRRKKKRSLLIVIDIYHFVVSKEKVIFCQNFSKRQNIYLRGSPRKVIYLLCGNLKNLSLTCGVSVTGTAVPPVAALRCEVRELVLKILLI